MYICCDYVWVELCTWPIWYMRVCWCMLCIALVCEVGVVAVEWIVCVCVCVYYTVNNGLKVLQLEPNDSHRP